jgi:acyl-CoA thioester hydrolase
MELFRFYYAINVRYADLDPQGHVNNAKYLTYLEDARVAYLVHLSLWDGKSFLDVGIILAEARVTYRAPIFLGQAVKVGVRVSRIGNKSFVMNYALIDDLTGKTLAQASTVLVTFDYRSEQTITMPESWRKRIEEFEGLETKPTKLIA